MNKILNIIILTYYKIIYRNKIKIGKNVSFRGKLHIRIKKNAQLIIGDNCFFNNNCSINVLDKITIGDDCIFGENVKIYDHNHVFDIKNKKIKDSGYKIEEVKIGNDCWICSNCTVLKGSKIGTHCVLSANSKVKGTIPSNSIYSDNKISSIKFKEN